MKCSICNEKIETVNGWSEGHNARPMREGRCCNRCNVRHVVPARMYASLAAKEGITGAYADLSVQQQDEFRALIDG